LTWHFSKIEKSDQQPGRRINRIPALTPLPLVKGGNSPTSREIAGHARRAPLTDATLGALGDQELVPKWSPKHQKAQSDSLRLSL